MAFLWRFVAGVIVMGAAQGPPLARSQEQVLEVMQLLGKTIIDRLNTMEKKLDALQTKMDAMQTNMDAMQTNMDAMQTNMDAMQTKMDAYFQRRRLAITTLTLCTVPVYPRNGSHRGALTLLRTGSTEWVITAAHVLWDLRNSLDNLFSPIPLADHREVLPKVFLEPAEWWLVPQCDVAARLLTQHWKQALFSSYDVCYDRHLPALPGEEIGLFVPNQPLQFSWGSVVGQRDQPHCKGTMALDAVIRPGYSGAGACIDSHVVGIVVSELFESVLSHSRFRHRRTEVGRLSRLPDPGQFRLYGILVPVNLIREYLEDVSKMQSSSSQSAWGTFFQHQSLEQQNHDIAQHTYVNRWVDILIEATMRKMAENRSST